MTSTHVLDDLQSRLAFQEQTLGDLSDVVARQAEQIDRLQSQLQVLAQQHRSLRESVDSGAGGMPGDEPPPHY